MPLLKSHTRYGWELRISEMGRLGSGHYQFTLRDARGTEHAWGKSSDLAKIEREGEQALEDYGRANFGGYPGFPSGRAAFVIVSASPRARVDTRGDCANARASRPPALPRACLLGGVPQGADASLPQGHASQSQSRNTRVLRWRNATK